MIYNSFFIKSCLYQHTFNNPLIIFLFIKSIAFNLYSFANVIEVCLTNNITNIVDIYTIGIYSSQNMLPWNEIEYVFPSNYYNLSKFLIEKQSEFFISKGLKIKTLRLAQVIGLGEREGYALQVYLNNAIKGLPIKVMDNSIGKRQYVYVKDVVNAIIAALENQNLSGIFNIGMCKNYSFDELANVINKTFGGKSEIIYDKTAKSDDNIYMMDITKAKNELNWSPKYDLVDAYNDIKELIEGSSII